MPTLPTLPLQNANPGDIITSDKWNAILAHLNNLAGALTVDGGKVGVAGAQPKEAFQIGDRWTFHNGGSKFIGYNMHYAAMDKYIDSAVKAAVRLGFGDGGLSVHTASGSTNTDGSIQFNPGGLSVGIDGTVQIIGKGDPKSSLHIKGNPLALDIEGETHAYIRFFPQGYQAGRKAWIGFDPADSNDLAISADTNNLGLHANHVSINGSELYVSGNVGIGVTTPKHKLDVDGNILARWDANLESRLYLGDESHFIKSTHGNATVNVQVGNANVPVKGGVTIGTWGADYALRIVQQSGNIGIGVINPSEKLEIAGDALVIGKTGFNNNSGRTEASMYLGDANYFIRSFQEMSGRGAGISIGVHSVPTALQIEAGTGSVFVKGNPLVQIKRFKYPTKDTGFSVDDYNAAIVGFNNLEHAVSNAGGSIQISLFLHRNSNNNWHIGAFGSNEAVPLGGASYVDVMFIRKEISIRDVASYGF